MAVEPQSIPGEKKRLLQDPHQVLPSLGKLPRYGEEGLDVFPQWWVKDFISIIQGKDRMVVEFDRSTIDPRVLIPDNREFNATIYLPLEYQHGLQRDPEKIMAIASMLGAIYSGEEMEVDEIVYFWKGQPYFESELNIRNVCINTGDEVPQVVGVDKRSRQGERFRKDVRCFVTNLLLPQEVWEQAKQLASELISKEMTGQMRRKITEGVIIRKAVAILEGQVDGIEGMQFPEGFVDFWLRHVDEDERGYAWKWLLAYPDEPTAEAGDDFDDSEDDEVV